MSDREPRLETLIETIVENRLSYLHTALPAKVVEFVASENKVSVQPLIKDSFIDDEGNDIAEDLPQIDDVPVVYPRGANGGFHMSWPLQVDDIVMLVFAERSMDRWVGGDDPTQSVDPVDFRKHQLSDCWAVPGGYPFGDPVPVETDKVVIKFGATEIHVGDDIIELGEKGAGEKVSIDSKVQDALNQLRDDLDTLAGIYGGHTHTVPLSTGTGNLGAPLGGTALAPAPGDQNTIGSIPSTASTLVTIKE